MAIEAARQVANRPESITGYKLLDVSFPKALISIPRANDFETSTFLRPVGTSDNKASGFSEFRIYSLTNGDWAENCRGTIKVEYKIENDEVDCGNEDKMELQYCKEVYATAVKSCHTPIESAMLYELLGSLMGLSYGDAFQTLDKIRYSELEVIAQVELRKWTTNVNEWEYQDHVIHPTALDGVLQLCLVAILQGGRRRAPTMVPNRIDEVWISASGLAQPSIKSAKAYAKLMHYDLREARCTSMALDNITYEPRVLVKGFQALTVDGQSSTLISSLKSWERLCYSLDWRPDVDLLSQQELHSYCTRSASAESPPDKFIDDMEFICYTFICDALEQMDREDITDIKAQFDRYVSWMKRQSHRYLRGEMVHWQPDWPQLRRDKTYTQSVIDRVGAFSAEGKLYAETGKNLLGILEGKIDALDLLFTGKLAAGYYLEANGTKKTLKTIETYVDALAHKSPGLNILEIGAGTGSATEYFLQNLLSPGRGEHDTPRYAQYTFTDISPLFFDNAKEKFRDHSMRMVYTTLDIEQDPLLQGFLENDYDLIIASNVSFVQNRPPLVTEFQLKLVSNRSSMQLRT